LVCVYIALQLPCSSAELKTVSSLQLSSELPVHID